ncbi:hypothetical protein PsYK624_108720 [Phanerochaete sordida]|uniref:Uncharacterized protein n=1 Tax=Phanerochaete sordida TaxID=48140 RepID=A0A9P3GGV4_9APHY|nr:hypothetical protein PsYK624_108720 [Phanerochaete sordida]
MKLAAILISIALATSATETYCTSSAAIPTRRRASCSTAHSPRWGTRWGTRHSRARRTSAAQTGSTR